jgi:predicted HicB family RNase H-like nuclease
MSEQQRVTSRQRGRGGRPSKGPRVYVGLRIPEADHTEIEEARAQSGLSVNDFCIGLIMQAMDAGLIPSGQAPGQDRLPLSA